MQLLAIALVLAQAAPPAAPLPQPAPAPAPTGPVVALEVAQGRTALGTITIVLNQEKAPVSVRNFLSYVRSGHYDGTVFHRIMPSFMIQGGGFTPELEEKPTQAPIRNEARNGLRNSRGAVAMARTTASDSATSQFFINLKDNHMLDFGISGAGYAVFGQVIEGMDVVDRIAAVPTTSRGPHQSVPQVAVVIRKAREVETAAPVAAPQPAEPTQP
jgi:peptidyl-prolyl cis-trans isomerase A (cyclophilin A)